LAIAGFPDVLAWLNDTQKSSNSSVSISISSEDMSERDIENPDGSLRACYNFNLVRNYIAQTGRSLEVAVEEARQRMG
jgi:hypothetical protein